MLINRTPNISTKNARTRTSKEVNIPLRAPTPDTRCEESNIRRSGVLAVPVTELSCASPAVFSPCTVPGLDVADREELIEAGMQATLEASACSYKINQIFYSFILLLAKKMYIVVMSYRIDLWWNSIT